MEFALFIQSFGFYIISLYTYKKILDIKDVSKLKIASAIIFSLIMSVPMLYGMFIGFMIYDLILLLSLCIFVSIISKIKTDLMISAVVISVGISYGIDILVQSILFIPYILFETIHLIVGTKQGNIPLETMQNYTQDDLLINLTPALSTSICFIIGVIFIYFLFKIKRLKKGFIFLQHKEARWIGIIFSMLIIIIYSFAGYLQFNYIETHTVSEIGTGPIITCLFLLIAINICTIGVHFWWRHHTNTLYQQRLKERTIRENQSEIDEKDNQIKDQSECIEFLSETLHRDNKLIPAMYNAVSDFLSNSDNSIENEIKMKGMHILSELDEIMKERKKMISKIHREHKSLPSTEIELIDNILNYMFLKALESEIQFDFVMTGSIKDIAESVIAKQKLETLLADLIENAIIAASYSTNKKILLTMGIVEDCYEINVQDSGIPFEVETLNDLGLKKSTTHADKGGSGIGYLTIFKILNESRASLIISEQVPAEYTFSKSIKVRFDGKSEFVIYTYRSENIKPSVEREGMFILGSH